MHCQLLSLLNISAQASGIFYFFPLLDYLITSVTKRTPSAAFWSISSSQCQCCSILMSRQEHHLSCSYGINMNSLDISGLPWTCSHAGTKPGWRSWLQLQSVATWLLTALLEKWVMTVRSEIYFSLPLYKGPGMVNFTVRRFDWCTSAQNCIQSRK